MKNILLPTAIVLSASALSASAQVPASFPVGGLKFQRPADWEWIPVQSSMRKAQLSVPGEETGKAAEVTFFHFGPSGGGDVESNVQRWLRQFQSTPGAEKVESKEIGGRKVTLVSTEGTFSSGMPGGPQTAMADFALLGAILENSQGNVFVKMTGPKKTVLNAKSKFLEFLATTTQ